MSVNFLMYTLLNSLMLHFIIEDEVEDGYFLVRESNTAPGDYVLSVQFEGEVIHYQIRRHGEDAFFSIGKTYNIA